MNDTTNGLIAVTGATGEVGGRVARRLASRGLAQRLIVRAPKRMEAIPGADVRAIAGYQVGTEVCRALSGVGTFKLTDPPGPAVGDG
jgi:NAD(P)H dehydrogenase (quinone)